MSARPPLLRKIFAGARPAWLGRALRLTLLAALAIVLLAPLVGDLVEAADLVGAIAPVALIPLALAVLVVFWPWRRRWVAWALVGMVGAGLLSGIAPSRAAAPMGSTATMLVMTYNLGNGLAKPAALATMLHETDADIVALVELTTEVAEALAPAVADRYPYQALFGGGIPGKGLLSRYPIVAAESLDLAPGRPDLLAQLLIDDRKVTVIVAHPAPPRWRGGLGTSAATHAQRARLLELTTTNEPLLLLGDFNMTDRQAAHRRIAATGLNDAFAAAGTGAGYTFPTRLGPAPLLPFMRLDYVWHSAHFETRAAWVGLNAGSDHLPVLARLDWREPG